MPWSPTFGSHGLVLIIAASAVFLNTGLARAWEEEAKTNEVKPSIGGYCPVSYQTQSKPVKGEPALAVTHEGLTYLCVDADAKKLFEKDPKKYAPKYGGLCTTALGGTYGNRIPADPEVFYVIEGKLYLFSSMRARNAFDRWPPQYIEKADALFAIPAVGGYCIVSYAKSGKAVKGDAKLSRTYGRLVYHFADESAASEFDANPRRYLPQYEGFCAEGMSRGKNFPADPTLFDVRDGKTYLFFDAAAKSAFEKSPKETIAKADDEWVRFLAAREKQDAERLEGYRKMSTETHRTGDSSPPPQPAEPPAPKP